MSSSLSDNEGKISPARFLCPELGAAIAKSKAASLFELSTVCLYETNSNFTCPAAFNAFSPLMELNKALSTRPPTRRIPVSGDTAYGLATQNAPWHYPRPAFESPLTVKFAYIPRLLHPPMHASGPWSPPWAPAACVLRGTE